MTSPTISPVPIQVMVAEDHTVVRQGIVAILNQRRGHYGCCRS